MSDLTPCSFSPERNAGLVAIVVILFPVVMIDIPSPWLKVGLVKTQNFSALTPRQKPLGLQAFSDDGASFDKLPWLLCGASEGMQFCIGGIRSKLGTAHVCDS